jgi:hypothetical protein
MNPTAAVYCNYLITGSLLPRVYSQLQKLRAQKKQIQHTVLGSSSNESGPTCGTGPAGE